MIHRISSRINPSPQNIPTPQRSVQFGDNIIVGDDNGNWRENIIDSVAKKLKGHMGIGSDIYEGSTVEEMAEHIQTKSPTIVFSDGDYGDYYRKNGGNLVVEKANNAGAVSVIVSGSPEKYKDADVIIGKGDFKPKEIIAKVKQAWDNKK